MLRLDLKSAGRSLIELWKPLQWEQKASLRYSSELVCSSLFLPEQCHRIIHTYNLSPTTWPHWLLSTKTNYSSYHLSLTRNDNIYHLSKLSSTRNDHTYNLSPTTIDHIDHLSLTTIDNTNPLWPTTIDHTDHLSPTTIDHTNHLSPTTIDHTDHLTSIQISTLITFNTYHTYLLVKTPPIYQLQSHLRSKKRKYMAMLISRNFEMSSEQNVLQLSSGNPVIWLHSPT